MIEAKPNDRSGAQGCEARSDRLAVDSGAAGRKRLREVAKECVNDGQRAQNSVFGCVLHGLQLLLLKDSLVFVIDEE